MIAKLIVPISQHILMNDMVSPPVMMSMPFEDTLLDCSDSWTDRDGIGYETMSRSWGRGLEVSITPAGPPTTDERF
jgi:hypothetical protein